MAAQSLPIFSRVSLCYLGIGLIVGAIAGLTFKGGQRNISGQVETVSGEIADAPSENILPSQLPSPQPDPVPALLRLRQLSADETGTELAACMTLVRELSLADCREAFTLFNHWPTGEGQILRREIARRWAKLDPEDALSRNARSGDQTVLSEAASELVERDPEAALTRLSQPGRVPKILLARFVLTALSAKDPVRAANFLASRPEFAADDHVFRVVGGRWAKSDPAAALGWATSLPHSRARNEALQAIWTTWAENDPSTVAASITQASTPQFDRSVLQSVSRNWSKLDPNAALLWIQNLPQQADRDTAWSAFTLDIQKFGAEASISLLQKIPSHDRRGQIAARVTSKWARDDPAAARAWAERLPEGPVRDQALRPVLDEWAGQEPVAAVSYVSALPAGTGRTDLLRRVVGSWAMQDPAAAIQWSQTLPAGAERDVVAGAAMIALQEVADHANAGHLLELVEDPAHRRELVGNMVGRWARSDGATAAKWLDQLPDSTSQVEGHRNLARQWGLTDYNATAQWLAQLPGGAARDAAVGAFVQSVDGYDPALATTWANVIEQAEEREKTVRSAFDRWLDKDVSAAAGWLKSAHLSEPLRLELLGTAEEKLRRQ